MRMMDSEQNLPNRSQHMLVDERYQLLSNEAHCIPLNAGVGLRSPRIPPVYTLLHSGQDEGLCERNYGRRGLEFIAELFRQLDLNIYRTCTRVRASIHTLTHTQTHTCAR